MSGGHDCDVIVVGGGLVGAACALALARQGLRLALVEAAPPPAPDDAGWDRRIYAISPGNAAFLAGLGVWDALDAARIEPIAAMRVYGDDGVSGLEFDAYQAGAEALGHIVESRLLQTGLWARLREREEVELLAGARCAALRLEDAAARLVLADGRTLRARLVVGADGGHSWIREQAGIGITGSDYRQSGVVANFATERPHRGIARQWFRSDGILAWLPLPGDRMSMVWSTHPEHARALCAMTPEALCGAVAEAGGHTLGALSLLTPAAAFPLRLMHAEVLVRPRLALVGDAAHLVHPLAGQGVNLGFHDAAALAQVLGARGAQADAGDYFLLRRFERARKLDIRAMQATTDGLYTLFSSTLPGIAGLRNWGMALTNRLGWLKRRLMAHAML